MTATLLDRYGGGRKFNEGRTDVMTGIGDPILFQLRDSSVNIRGVINQETHIVTIKVKA